MIPKSRVTLASFIVGLVGAAIGGLISFGYVSQGIGIPEYTIAIGIFSGFLSCFLVSVWYLRFMADKTWRNGIFFGLLFGGLAGAMSGAVTGMSAAVADSMYGEVVSISDVLLGSLMGLYMGAILGAFSGAGVGLIFSLIFGPILARFSERGSDYTAQLVSEQRAVKTSKPTIAGVLNIITGAISIIGAVFIFTGFSIEFGAWSIPQMGAVISLMPLGMVVGTGIFILLIAVLVLIGGVFALQRKHWGWALTGSIATILSLYLTIPLRPPIISILIIILIGLSKNEFEN